MSFRVIYFQIRLINFARETSCKFNAMHMYSISTHFFKRLKKNFVQMNICYKYPNR